LITRALIAVASLGTFALLVAAMGPPRQSDGPTGVDDVSVPATTPTVINPGQTATTVLTVGDIGQMSAALHQRSAPAGPPTTGR
jgi:hypothetical protein